MRNACVVGAVFAWLSAGCGLHNGHGHGGHLVAEYRQGQEPCKSRVPYEATYALYRWNEPPDPPPHTWLPEDQVSELFVRGLARRQDIGFAREDGKLFAVAGDEKILLEEGRYCWHVSSHTRYPMAKWVIGQTTNTATDIISLPFGLAATAILLPFLALGALCALPFLFW